MKMLRWTCGVSKKDKIRNTYIRGSLYVDDIEPKLRKRRLKWFRKMKLKGDGYIGNQILNMEVDGKRRQGGQRKTWLKKVEDDLNFLDIKENLLLYSSFGEELTNCATAIE